MTNNKWKPVNWNNLTTNVKRCNAKTALSTRKWWRWTKLWISQIHKYWQAKLIESGYTENKTKRNEIRQAAKRSKELITWWISKTKKPVWISYKQTRCRAASGPLTGCFSSPANSYLTAIASKMPEKLTEIHEYFDLIDYCDSLAICWRNWFKIVRDNFDLVPLVPASKKDTITSFVRGFKFSRLVARITVHAWKSLF